MGLGLGQSVAVAGSEAHSVGQLSPLTSLDIGCLGVVGPQLVHLVRDGLVALAAGHIQNRGVQREAILHRIVAVATLVGEVDSLQVTCLAVVKLHRLVQGRAAKPRAFLRIAHTSVVDLGEGTQSLVAVLGLDSIEIVLIPVPVRSGQRILPVLDLLELVALELALAGQAAGLAVVLGQSSAEGVQAASFLGSILLTQLRALLETVVEASGRSAGLALAYGRGRASLGGGGRGAGLSGRLGRAGLART